MFFLLPAHLLPLPDDGLRLELLLGEGPPGGVEAARPGHRRQRQVFGGKVHVRLDLRRRRRLRRGHQRRGLPPSSAAHPPPPVLLLLPQLPLQPLPLPLLLHLATALFLALALLPRALALGVQELRVRVLVRGGENGRFKLLTYNCFVSNEFKFRSPFPIS